MQAFFADIRSKMVEYIDEAQQTIFIAMAWFTNQVLFQLLLDKAAGGVKIELLISSSESNFLSKSALPFELLLKKGVKVKILESKEGFQFMHHKFCVIDDKLLITGSYNWSNNAHTNFENIIVIQESNICKAYSLQFQKLLENESIITLEDFKGKNEYYLLNESIKSDSEMVNLANQFNQKVIENLSEVESLRLGIKIDIITSMIKRYTAVGAARKLSNDQEQSGFIKLVSINRADLTFEYMTAKSEYSLLFDKVTIKNAKAKLHPYIGRKVNEI